MKWRLKTWEPGGEFLEIREVDAALLWRQTIFSLFTCTPTPYTYIRGPLMVL